MENVLKTVKPINFDLKQLKKVDSYAEKNRISRAEAIRDMITYFFETNKAV